MTRALHPARRVAGPRLNTRRRNGGCGPAITMSLTRASRQPSHASSTSEQSGAGIHECSAEEFARFTELNDAYKARFGFPFIMAVKGSNRHQILAAFEERIHNAPEQEFARALAEINKIALFRLQAL